MPATGPTVRVLLVEDSQTDARRVLTAAARSMHVKLDVVWVDSLRKALDRLTQGDIELILLDLMLPDSGPQDTFAAVQREVPGIPIVVWTSLEDLESASQAIRGGAQDYLPKSRLDAELLERTVRYAVDRHQIRKELERSNRELDEFAHIVSHDLKAPLRAIHHLAQIVKEDLGGATSPNVAANLERLSDRALRLSQMIDGVLNYSRRVRVREAPSRFPVQGLVDEVWENLHPPSTYRLEVATPLPDLETDRVRILEVFQNLVGNAVQHHDKGGGRIRVGAKELPEHFEFFVEDDGPGIAEHEQGRLFDLFHPPSVQQRPESTHVGLAIVKKIVESHGGKIWVEAAPKRGSVFRFTWPKDDTSPLRQIGRPLATSG